MRPGRWDSLLDQAGQSDTVGPSATTSTSTTTEDGYWSGEILEMDSQSYGARPSQGLASPHWDIWMEPHPTQYLHRAGHLGWAWYLALGCPTPGTRLETTRHEIQDFLRLDKRRANRLLRRLHEAALCFRVSDGRLITNIPYPGDYQAQRARDVACDRAQASSRGKRLAAASGAEIAMAYSVRDDLARLAEDAATRAEQTAVDRLVDLRAGGLLGALDSVQSFTGRRPTTINRPRLGSVGPPAKAVDAVESASDTTLSEVVDNRPSEDDPGRGRP